MLTTIMKWVSISVLLLAAIWRSSPDHDLLLQFVVCAAAILVVWQAFRTTRYLWAAGFAAIAILFNPIQPFEFSPAKFLWLDLICLSAFALSLTVLKAKPAGAIERSF